jgi:hypothetical protein
MDGLNYSWHIDYRSLENIYWIKTSRVPSVVLDMVLSRKTRDQPLPQLD